MFLIPFSTKREGRWLNQVTYNQQESYNHALLMSFFFTTPSVTDKRVMNIIECYKSRLWTLAGLDFLELMRTQKWSRCAELLLAKLRCDTFELTITTFWRNSKSQGNNEKSSQIEGHSGGSSNVQSCIFKIFFNHGEGSIEVNKSNWGPIWSIFLYIFSKFP